MRLEFAEHSPVSIAPVKGRISWHREFKPHPITARSNHLYGLFYLEASYPVLSNRNAICFLLDILQEAK